MTYRTSSSTVMDPSTTVNLIEFAKGRQEILDLTVPLKGSSTSTKRDEDPRGAVGGQKLGQQEEPRRRHTFQKSEENSFGVFSSEDQRSRRRSSLEHGRKNSVNKQNSERWSLGDAEPTKKEVRPHRRRSMERSEKKQQSKGNSGPPKRGKSFESVSTSRRMRSESSRNLMKLSTERSQSSRNLGLTKSTERSQSARNLSLSRSTSHSQSARNLSSSRSTERSQSSRHLSLTMKPSDDSSGSGCGGKDKLRPSRRPKDASNVSTGSASSSSRSHSKNSRVSMMKTQSLKSISLKDELVDPKSISSKSSYRSSSKLSPKCSRKDLRESKQSSSRSLKEKKPSSFSASHRQQNPALSSPVKESRSPTTPRSSPKVATARLRNEMKSSLKNFPDLQGGGKSPPPSPKSLRNNIILNHDEAASDNHASSSTTSSSSSSSSPKERTSRNSHRRRSQKSEGKTDGSSRRTGQQKSKPILRTDDDGMPTLIDDSLQRDRLEGKKGDKSWHICEDTPGGHAPERLIIVEGVEYYTDSLDEDEDILDDDDEDAAEDDTILQDSVSLPRPNRKQILPRDPAQKVQKNVISHTARPADRFNPSFQSKEMWKSDGYKSSGELTMNSLRAGEEIDTASELDTTITDNTLTNHTFETYMLEQDCSHQHGKQETPSTLKRAGGRRVENDTNPSFPGLQAESNSDKDGHLYDENRRHPSPVPEDDVMECCDVDAVGLRRKVISKSTGAQQNTGSSSTGRSSRRKGSTSRSNQRRSGKRPTKGSEVPTVVASSPYELSPSLRSPLSSSFTSPQSMSMNSSGRQNPEWVSLRRPNENTRNKTLQNFVGRGQSSPRTDDDNTLGASTITTNFSSTQRTFGDNTVSTRSLFNSDVMKGSDMMKIPQRRRGYDSDEDTADCDDQMPGVPSLDAVSANFDMLQSNDTMALIDSARASEQNAGGRAAFKPVRRPSKEVEDFFDEMEEMRVSSDQSDFDSYFDSYPNSAEFDATKKKKNNKEEEEHPDQHQKSASDRFCLSSGLNFSSRAGVVLNEKKSKRNESSHGKIEPRERSRNRIC